MAEDQAPEGTEETSETFDRAYVERLRAEAAEGRTKAKRHDVLAERLRETALALAAGSILSQPADLPWTADLEDAEGLPDLVKITEAAEALAERRPAVSRARGSVAQGEHSEADSGAVSWLELLRG